MRKYFAISALVILSFLTISTSIANSSSPMKSLFAKHASEIAALTKQICTKSQIRYTSGLAFISSGAIQVISALKESEKSESLNSKVGLAVMKAAKDSCYLGVKYTWAKNHYPKEFELYLRSIHSEQKAFEKALH